MEDLLAARIQMALSLGFHMVFASLGMTMPLMMVFAEGVALVRKDRRYLEIARTWAKATGILFAIGAVSGTALAFEMGLLWPAYMAYAGGTIGPAFAVEAYAFFTEAIFLGIYLYAWERLSPLAHFLTGIPVALGAMASAALVVAANAWMQSPIQGPSPAATLFGNPAYLVMTVHSTLSAYTAGAWMVAGVYAYGALRGRGGIHRQTALLIAMAVGTVGALTMPLTGHWAAQSVAVRQPEKLAAMESQFVTERRAPLRIGGWPDTERGEVRWALEIPGGLSWLAFGDANAEVMGLDRVPRDEWPNVALTHISFQVMVGAGTAMLVIALWFWLRHRRRRQTLLQDRGLMRLLVLASPLGIIALQAGWIVTCVGRQPWIIWKVMRTSEAVTGARGLTTTLIAFTILYALLSVTLVYLLVRLKHKEEAA